MKRILIIEDDNNLSRGIAFAFEKDGYSVVIANSLKFGQTYLKQQDIDVVILDVNLPDGNGIDFCIQIRQTLYIPIIILTVCDLETDEVSGLMAGADDYITKPFSLSVLKARVASILRRYEMKENHIIQLGRYRLDTNKCKLFCGEKEIYISATEFKLLKYFLSNAGQTLTKEQILSFLWDNNGKFVGENTLSVNISRLRAKIEENPKEPKVIKTIHSIGYMWVKE